MSDSSLVQIDPSQPTSLSQGLGIDTSSPLFTLRPGTLVINQPNTQDENAIKGHYRITQTGDQYKELTVALLMTPEEARAYYIGEPGQMNRSQENLMCFSRAKGCHLKGRPPSKTAGPDKKSRAMENATCLGCPRSDWGPYRLFVEKHPNQPVPKTLLPACDPYYYIAMVDTEFQMPLEMYVRGKSIEPFEAFCQNLYRAFLKFKAATKTEPNIFDFKFTLQTKMIENKASKTKSYIIQIPGTSIKVITPEEREAFGAMYVQYAESRNPQLTAGNADRVIAAEASIDAAVTGTQEGIAGDDETIVF